MFCSPRDAGVARRAVGSGKGQGRFSLGVCLGAFSFVRLHAALLKTAGSL